MSLTIDLMDARAKALASVRQRKKAMEEVERILTTADAETIALLQEAFSPNGKVAKTSPGSTSMRVETAAAIASAPIQRFPRLRKGELDSRVKEAVKHFPNMFRVRDVHDRLIKEGFKFASKNSLVSVGVVLRKLKKNEILEQARPASGQTGAMFRLKSQ